MNLHGKNFVGSELISGDGNTFRAVSPLNSQPLEAIFHQATPEMVDATLQVAEDAFADYRKKSGAERAELLEHIAAEIMALGDTLIERAHAETGLAKDRLEGERARTVNQLKMFAELACEGSWVDARIDRAQPERKPVAKPDLRRMLIPIGPVVVFGASNFPLAFSVAGGDTASALAAGCTVIVKAHEAHPGTSELVATAIRKAIERCKLHSGVFSMLHGSGPIIGIALVKHPLTQAVGFTGSLTAGRALFDAAARRPLPIPVFAEMSSLNPLFILPGALRQRGAQIAEGLKASITLGAGQFCTKPGLIFGVSSLEWDAFERALALLMEDGVPATMLHAGISASYHDSVAYVSKIEKVHVVAKSKTPPDSRKTQAEPILLKTVGANFLRNPRLSEEIFGPAALLVLVQSISEMEEIASSLDGQLTATVHCTDDDLRHAGSLLNILERKAGRLIINGFPTGVEVCPSMHHGGPAPATSDARFTSVGPAAIFRFSRPICYQDVPDALLPEALRDSNPLSVHRLVNGKIVYPTISNK